MGTGIRHHGGLRLIQIPRNTGINGQVHWPFELSKLCYDTFQPEWMLRLSRGSLENNLWMRIECYASMLSPNRIYPLWMRTRLQTCVLANHI